MLNGSSHLRLLDTTRTYALAKLMESGEVDSVSRKLGSEAETMITAALEQAEARRKSFDMPELLHTRAQIGIVSGRLDSRAAETMLRHSIELATSQGALSLELARCHGLRCAACE